MKEGNYIVTVGELQYLPVGVMKLFCHPKSEVGWMIR